MGIIAGYRSAPLNKNIFYRINMFGGTAEDMDYLIVCMIIYRKTFGVPDLYFVQEAIFAGVGPFSLC